MHKEVRQFSRRLLRDGWSKLITGTGHLRLTHPSGKFITVAMTPSDSRWIRNAEAEVKRLLRNLGDWRPAEREIEIEPPLAVVVQQQLPLRSLRYYFPW